MIIKKSNSILSSLIDNYLEKNPDVVSSSTKLSPTYIIGCERQCIYKLRGCPQKQRRSAKSSRIALNGDYMHKRYFELFEKMGILKEKEKFISHPTFPFIGFVDAIISINNSLYLIELKSISHDNFGKLKKPLEEHLMQVKLYLMLLRGNISKGIILYEDKNTQDLKEFLVEYDSQIEDWFNQKFSRLLTFFNAGNLPERICFNIQDGINRWCPYVDECFKEERNEMEEKCAE